MTGENQASEALEGDNAKSDVRYCRYVRCGRELPAVTRPGRKPEYCDDRKWEDGRSCKLMAQADQRAEKVAGLDAPLLAYRTATERVAPALTELRERLDEVLNRAIGVDDAALARVEAAESAMSEMVERAQKAENRATTAENKRAEAVRQANEARTAKQAAERLARDAEREKEEEWIKRADAQAAQARAEQAAADTKANLDAYVTRYNRLADENTELEKKNKQVSGDNTRLEAELKAAKEAHAELAERTTAEIARLNGLLEEQRAAAEAETVRIAAEHELTVDELRKELAGVREKLAAETSRAASAESDRDAARSRLDELQGRFNSQREELVATQARAEAAETAREQGELKLAELRDRVENLTADLGAARGRAESAEASAGQLRQDNAELHARTGQLTSELAAKTSDLDQVRAELDRATTALADKTAAERKPKR